MESDCRIPMSCLRPRVLALHVIFWGLVSLRVFGPALLSVEAIGKPVGVPCWQVEEVVVATECSVCGDFQMKRIVACSQTGYVERINCTMSKKEEYKSCRSSVMDEHLFWKFEGATLGLTVFFALIVVARQRALDRQASEKVRRQIESI